jgi:peptidoglycan/xylan/chitin deacetylase (PgdA/CDA1 family)
MRRWHKITIAGVVVAALTGLGTPATGVDYPKSTYVVPTSMRGIDYEKIPTTRKVVALTFDAGANAAAQASIMRTLGTKGVKGTFFLTGKWVRAHPNYTKNIVLKGHVIGNHSDTHPYFNKLTVSQQRFEIRKAAYFIKQNSGKDPGPWFRFPYGARTTENIRVVNNDGYVAVRWTVDTLGWKGTSGGMTAYKVKQRVLSTLTPGQIVLMHVGSHPTDGSMLDAAALPGIIDALRAKGYGFVTLSTLLAP